MTREQIMQLDGDALDMACVLMSRPERLPGEWHPSTDANHAIQFAEAMRKAGRIVEWRIVSPIKNGVFVAEVWPQDDFNQTLIENKSLAISLCQAVLIACLNLDTPAPAADDP